MSIKENIMNIRKNIKIHAELAGRNPEDIMLLAVTKTVYINRINEALNCGITDIGENKVQELCEKYPKLKDNASFHLIGHLQTNKVKYIIDKVKMIHSLDSIHLAKEINKKAHEYGRIIDCLVEINIADEKSKYGIPQESIYDFINHISIYDNIMIKGLMTVAPNIEAEKVRPYFKKMKEIYESIKKIKQKNLDVRYLSMGMTNDYTIAVEEGANILRIGTAIFGKRLYKI